ncbi:TPA: MATE family efflux transporter [Candidatus Spyradomonas excrementavium]|nr:MATE family efflux transporter [Candidatus Spyradomonas excrementavium]
MINDMTKGAPLKLLLLFSVPLLIGNIFQQLYNIADIVIVGRTLGMNALAAVGATSPVFFFLMFVVVGLTNGFAVITGQRFGAKDPVGVRRSVTVSTVLSSVFTIVFSVLLGLFMNVILGWMNVPREIYKDAFWYIQIVVAGLISANAYNLLASIVRALGDSKTPLYFLIFASLLNIVLALLFILKFGWGVPGSAVAVVISQAVSACLCVVYVKKRFPILHLKLDDWKFAIKKESIPFAMEHLKVGIPMALQYSILGIGILIIQSVCNTFGPDVIAAFTAALRIEQIATLPMVSFGVALAAYTAQNFGANNYSRIRAGVKRSSLINISLSIIMAILIHFWGSNVVGIFLGQAETEIIKIAREYLWISTIFYFFLGQIFIFRNALQGMGEAVLPLAASIAELVIRSFAAVYLAVKFSYFGIFYAGPIAWVTASTILAAGYFACFFKIIKKARCCVRAQRKQQNDAAA